MKPHLHHYLRQMETHSLRQVFLQICSKFEKDRHLERKLIKAKMSKLRFKTLKSYVNSFTDLLTELEVLDGDRTHEDILDIFLAGIPNSQYLVHKETTSYDTPVDEAMDVFLKLADKKHSLGVHMKSTESSSARPVPRTVPVQQVTTTQEASTPSVSKSEVQSEVIPVLQLQPKNKHCIKCGGWGHTSGTCPTRPTLPGL